MIYQTNASKEVIKPIAKEALKRSNFKYLFRFIIAFNVLFALYLLSYICDSDAIFRLSTSIVEEMHIIMSAGLIRFYILFVFFIYLFLFLILILIILFIQTRSNIHFSQKNFDIDIKNGVVKTRWKRLLLKISWRRSFVYDDNTIVLKLKSDLMKVLPIIVFKNGGITEEDYNYLIMKIAKG